MIAVLSTVTTTSTLTTLSIKTTLGNAAMAVSAIPVPLAATLAIAVASLVMIGVAVRRLRTHGTLTLAHASTGAAAASFILAAALLASAFLGSAASATTIRSDLETQRPTVTAFTVPTVSTDSPDIDGFAPIPLDNVDGFQLPTK